MSWTPDRIKELEKLWAEGLSTAEIGRRLGVSKNAVVGKAHRLSLPGRQSPIDRKRRTTARRVTPRAKPDSAPRKPTVSAEQKPLATEKSPHPPPTLAKSHNHKGPSCQWPFGDPKLPGFHFCGAPSEPGKPYCSQHCAIAYNRVSASQADAEANKAAAA
ncbi:MAG: GcrA family cell cycle regulator [Rhodospirillales bacterium]